MKILRVLLGMLLLFFLSNLLAATGFFPYPVVKKTLKNGLDVVVIETPEFNDVLSYNTLVLAGARNEIKEGQSGLAHLFEHILFRHRWQDRDNGYDQAINRMGAFNNAWTNFDVTFYHPLTFVSNLMAKEAEPGLAQLEADRFQNLDFTEEMFKTEAGAVLGEYRRIASDPGLKMDEVMLKLAFPEHSYGHTTIGYLEDVQDMPNEYQAALEFYRTYYRPNHVVLIVTGDVKAPEIFDMAERLYGDWEAGPEVEIPQAEPLRGPHKQHVSWETDVPPRVSYAYRMPAFDPSTTAGAVGQLLPELLAGETAPLLQKLRYEKRSVNQLAASSYNYESFDSRFLEVAAVLFKDQYESQGGQYFEEVIGDIQNAFEDLKGFSRREDAEKTLDELKSKFRYDLLATFDSPSNIAQQFAWYYRFGRDPEVFDQLMKSVEGLTPGDIDRFASDQFQASNRVIVTLSHKGEGS